MRELSLPTNEQFICTSKLREMGFSYYYINKMVSQGLLDRINKSTYENIAHRK